MDSANVKIGFELVVSGDDERKAVCLWIKNLDEPDFPGWGVAILADELIENIRTSPSGTVIYSSDNGHSR